MANNLDKAGEQYWTEVWKNIELPEAIDPHSGNINKYPYQKFHKYFKKVFQSHQTEGKLMLEIGCGNSVWLPYFAKEFKMKVYGLDYSEYGCRQTEKILERENVSGEIILGDLFSPPDDLIGKFDYVSSFGVAEHFLDTTDIISKFAAFLKPGGYLITNIPNMTGANGYVQKLVNKPVYDIHVPLDKNDLSTAINSAGLELINAEYLLSIGFPVTLKGKDKPNPNLKLKKNFVLTLSRFSKIIWLIEKVTGISMPEGKAFSPNIMTIAQKPE